MADFEAPSFSLGLDFDLDSEPQITVTKHPSSSNPSFRLIEDDDFDLEPQSTVTKNPLLSEQARPCSTNPSFRLIEDEDDDDFEIPTVEREPVVSEPPGTLKRLRRGLGSDSKSVAPKRKSVELFCNVDDEIEDFSSQEDRLANEHSSTQYRSGCSSSKFPLHGHGVFTTQSTSQSKATKRKQASNTPASASLGTSSNKLMFPKLTVSPLRRFQLINSDSDDPSVSEDANREANKVNSSLKEKQFDPGQYPTTSGQKRMKASSSTSQTEDLWKDFYAEKSFHIRTPALDELCAEYFRSVKDKNEVSNRRHDKCMSDNKGSYQNCYVINNDENQCRLGDSTVPAHNYFFHDDPRIQKLVRSRLPYFFPLGAMNNRGNTNPISSVIDYMSQFSHGETSRQQATQKTNAEASSTRGRKNSKKSNAETSSTRRRKNSKKSNAEELPEGSGSWVNPKSSVGIPKLAGKRRVQAVDQSAGHWFTDPDGRRVSQSPFNVYVTKNGQELTGQNAYRNYKKETGAGFRRSGKKAASNKKTAANKKTAGKKTTAAKKRTAAKKK
ncbi:hypothetical protein HYC85_011650 [Camellia sinensis]|uniref:Uncharacterized protein n=1 Tax=Camellia sinensis TaxID=4442 RepID=A0A7J7HAU0_CAMSI|nr:hypothetical protein HYC85_011650 [Camellia sinensis]